MKFTVESVMSMFTNDGYNVVNASFIGEFNEKLYYSVSFIENNETKNIEIGFEVTCFK